MDNEKKMDFKTASFKQFNAISDAINLLKQAQINCEEIYISSSHDEDTCTED